MIDVECVCDPQGVHESADGVGELGAVGHVEDVELPGEQACEREGAGGGGREG